MAETGNWVIGADIGGTFTDVVIASADGANVAALKVPTTPEDPVLAVLDGVREILDETGVAPSDVARVVHATTLATNLILEAKGGPIAFITTEGFRDVVRIGHDVRTGPAKFDLLFDPPVQLVSGTLIFEAPERIDAAGKVHRELSDSAVDELVAQIGVVDITGVAVCLFHSYVNPEHEQRIGAALHKAYPDLHVALSSEVWPEFREYERSMTTIVSAYVGPALSGYVERLQDGLREMGIAAPFEIMQSSGGIMAASQVRSRAAYCVESGPAAGVIAASHLSMQRDRADAVSFDMGGTTAKAGLLVDGRVAITHNFRVGHDMSAGTGKSGMGVPLLVPVVDVAEVGTGGGSIAWIDDGGLLRVGPRSAGSVPGPACYGRGGELPTVTDADLVLGYLSEDRFLVGEGGLRIDAAREAIQRHIADPLGFDLTTAARGIHDVANAGVSTAIRVMSLHRGVDPRGLTMIAYGGAGPIHAARIAESCGISEIVVPSLPGVFSSVGLLVSERTYDNVRTKVIPAHEADRKLIDAMFAELERDASDILVSEGIDPATVRLERTLDMRYRQQTHALAVPVPSTAEVADLEQAFRERYKLEYGVDSEDAVEFVNFRVKAVAPASAEASSTLATHARGFDPHEVSRRPAYFQEAGEYVDTPVYRRGVLFNGHTLTGPLLIAEPDTTIVVPPAFTVHADPKGNVVIAAPKS
jgi:N-methylhydantoinase A